MVERRIYGDLSWIKTREPEEYEGKKSWSTIVHPDKDSLEMVRVMQAEGIKNKVKMDAKGWYTKFSRPTEKKKGDKITQTFTAPRVEDKEGKTVDGLVNNGSKGWVVVDLYEHPVKGGSKSHAARLEKVILDEYTLYGDAPPKVNLEVKQENYF